MSKFYEQFIILIQRTQESFLKYLNTAKVIQITRLLWSLKFYFLKEFKSLRMVIMSIHLQKYNKRNY